MDNRSQEERRSTARVPLDTPCFITLTLANGAKYQVMLANLSARGVQADLPLNVGANEVPGNSIIQLSGFPENMEHLNHTAGTVVWVTEGSCGIQFHQELEDKDFLDFLEIL